MSERIKASRVGRRPAVVSWFVVAILAGTFAGRARADASFPFHPCHSRWMSSAGSAWGTSDTSWTLNPGPPANFIVSMTPTSLARNVTLGTWSDVWRDLTKCVKFPSNLPRSEISSLQKQMDCHIYWSTSSFFPNGGKTWDFEGWRPDVSLGSVISPAQAIDKNKRCNWGADTGPALPLQPSPSSSSPQSPPAPSTSPASTQPSPVSTPGPSTPSSPTPSQPPRSTEGFFIEDSIYGGTWARTDPGDSTWYAKGTPPPNGAYWYPNGLGVAVDCSESAAPYSVVIYGAHSSWSWWAHVTDGKWVPTVVFSTVWSDGQLPGLPVC
jgi:hypothetical protein